MKTVFDNNGVIDAYLTHKLDFAKNHNYTLYFYADKIYSYGGHFPIANRYNNDFYLITSNKYSVTTSTQVNMVKDKIARVNNINKYVIVPVVIVESIADHYTNANYFIENYNRCITKAKKSKKQVFKNAHLTDAEYYRSSLIQYFRLFNLNSSGNKHLLK